MKSIAAGRKIIPVLSLLAGLTALALMAAPGPAFAQAASVEAAEPPQQNAEASMDALLEVLKDEAARDRLVRALEQATAGPAADAPSAPGNGSTLAGRLADLGGEAINGVVAFASNLASDLAGLGDLAESAATGDAGRLVDMLLPLALTLVVSLALWFALKRGLRALLGRVLPAFAGHGLVAGAARIFLYFAAEAVALGAAYFAAGASAALLFGGVSLYQTLYLNAFLVTGLAAMVIRLLTGIVEGGRYALLRFSPGMGHAIRRRGIVLTAILVFGIGFLVPAVSRLASLAVGRGLGILVFTAAALYAVAAIRAVSRIQKAERADVRSVAPPAPQDAGARADEAVDEAVPEPIQSAVIQAWPLLAYAYVAVAYVVALARPELLVAFVVGATLKTLAALVLGGLVMRGFGYLSALGVRAPDFLPLDSRAFSERLTLAIPVFLRILWFIVGLAVVGAVLDAWRIFDFTGWLADGPGGAIAAGLASSLVVVLTSAVVWAAATAWIDRRMERHAGTPGGARYRTLYVLLRNAVTAAVVIFGGMIALSELGVDIGPLIAGAGVIGLAVGFGSQKLVQDIISGIFIQLENAMNVGDVVSAGGITGVVERLTLRSVSLRDLSGIYHIVPFSSVDSVSNYMRHFSYHVEEVGIAYKEKVGDGKAAMEEAFERLMKTEHGPDILEPLEMHGVVALGDNAVVIRARIKTAPGRQFALGRAYTELVKEVMDERGIEIPFPQTTLHLARHKDGATDEFPVRLSRAGRSG